MGFSLAKKTAGLVELLEVEAIKPGTGGPLLLLCTMYFVYGWECMETKVLTYVEYRAVSDVFQNIDPHPPFLLESVSSPLR
jgi:hypothetical protein